MAEKRSGGEKPSALPEASNVTELTRDSIRALGARLDEFSSSLSEEERLVLAATVALAARGFSTFRSDVACVGGFKIGLRHGAMTVEPLPGLTTPRPSDALVAAFCAGGRSPFGIEGLEVERSVVGTKSVAAGAKSVAAWGAPSFAASKSVAAYPPGGMGSKSVAACRNPGLTGAKSVAACANPGFMGAKSVAACRNPGLMGAKSVAACRNPRLYGF